MMDGWMDRRIAFWCSDAVWCYAGETKDAGKGFFFVKVTLFWMTLAIGSCFLHVSSPN